MKNAKLFSFFQNSSAFRLLKILRNQGIEGRLVGGCVRDALLGRPVADIDIAVNVPPEKILAFAKKENLEAIPTGISHGTVTLLFPEENQNQSSRTPFEITSLRRDIQTDGRHAEISYTTHWEEDAARRDFTMNALYLDGDGNLFDYFQGEADLARGLVRFIGSPEERIREDYLRILRYYRFSLKYGKCEDAASVRAIAANIPFLKNLSKERIQAEILKILAEEDPTPALQKMQEHQVWPVLLGRQAQEGLLKRLRGALPLQNSEERALLRLFALFPYPADFFAQKLCLSKKQQTVLAALFQERETLPSEEQLFRIRYQCGDTIAKMWMAFQKAKEEGESEVAAPKFFWEKNIEALFSFPLPVFPLKGQDLLDAGFSAGKDCGLLLKECENWWLQSLGKKNKAECLQGILDLAPRKS
ncbi:poly(A) polymerase [Alphaproteobacteria bacterium]|nr:poly(A) polymerase [Alphaproteobacteria bacterium]GHS95892.1 poly(A) polymerase [Alphaproteobacteria bacterium]